MTTRAQRSLGSLRFLSRKQAIRRMFSLGVVMLIVLAGIGPLHPQTGEAKDAGSHPGIKHVFLIVEENRDWSDIVGSSAFPYINSLLDTGAHAENYHNVPLGQELHPSEPNYIVMEAGDTLGLESDDSPSENHSSTSTDHLVTFMEEAGISWTSYQEGISGDECPLQETDVYAPKHNPMVYFQDVTDNNSPTSRYCIEHVRPYEELEQDLTSNNVANYNFLTPDLCNDMHDDGCDGEADAWLSREIPMIMASDAYKDNGVIFLTWDEGGSGNEPIGMIVMSPLAKPGYSNTIAYTHASLLRTIQDIFGLQPYLGAAADAENLADLFVSGAIPDPLAYADTPPKPASRRVYG
jgi:phosphatidylinositol-3-phosphatase